MLFCLTVSLQYRFRDRKNVMNAKTTSFKYSVTHNKRTIMVCKEALCSLFAISKKKIEDYPNKKPRFWILLHLLIKEAHKVPDGVADTIKSHIEQFTAEISHYSRNRNFYRKYLSPTLSLNQLYNLYIEKCNDEDLPEEYKIKKCSYNKIYSTYPLDNQGVIHMEHVIQV